MKFFRTGQQKKKNKTKPDQSAAHSPGVSVLDVMFRLAEAAASAKWTACLLREQTSAAPVPRIRRSHLRERAVSTVAFARVQPHDDGVPTTTTRARSLGTPIVHADAFRCVDTDRRGGGRTTRRARCTGTKAVPTATLHADAAANTTTTTTAARTFPAKTTSAEDAAAVTRADSRPLCRGSCPARGGAHRNGNNVVVSASCCCPGPCALIVRAFGTSLMEENATATPWRTSTTRGPSQLPSRRPRSAHRRRVVLITWLLALAESFLSPTLTRSLSVSRARSLRSTTGRPAAVSHHRSITTAHGRVTRTRDRDRGAAAAARPAHSFSARLPPPPPPPRRFRERDYLSYSPRRGRPRTSIRSAARAAVRGLFLCRRRTRTTPRPSSSR